MYQGNLSVLLYVRDVNRALDFYCDVLGGRLAWMWDTQAQRASARVDRSRPIEFAAVHFGPAEILLRADPNYTPPARVRAVAQLLVEDVDSFHRSVVRRGWKPGPADALHPSEPTNMPWGARHVYLRDPDGHCLSFSSETGRGFL